MTNESNNININDAMKISLNTGLIKVGKNLKYNTLTAISTHEIIDRQRRNLFRNISSPPRLVENLLCAFIYYHLNGVILGSYLVFDLPQTSRSNS